MYLIAENKIANVTMSMLILFKCNKMQRSKSQYKMEK